MNRFFEVTYDSADMQYKIIARDFAEETWFVHSRYGDRETALEIRDALRLKEQNA